MTDTTIAALWATFKPRRVDTKRSGGEYTRLFDAHIRPSLGHRRTDKVTFQMIEKLHNDMRATPYQANRVLSLLRSLFKYAVALQWTKINPCDEVKQFPEKKRRRHMRPAEAPKIARVIALRENSSPASCLFLWLVIFSGARSGEISGAYWRDLKSNILLLDEHKTAEKTGVGRTIILPPAAMEKLDKLAPIETRHPDRKIIDIGRPEVLWQRYLRVEAKCPDLRVHDLRHTFGTYALEQGYTLDQIGESLNHTNPQTTKIYAELTDRSRQKIANDVSLGILADMMTVDVDDIKNPLS